MKKKGTIAFALIISSLASTAAIAAPVTEDQDVTVEIQGGSLALTSADINTFGTHTLKAKQGIITTNFKDKVIVEDSTGLQEGWNLAVSVSDFEEVTDASLTIPAENLSIVKPTVEDVTSGTAVTNTFIKTFNTDRMTLDTTAVNVATGEAGKSGGTFEFLFGELSTASTSKLLGENHLEDQAFELTVDPSEIKLKAGSAPSQFVATVTWTLSSGPGI